MYVRPEIDAGCLTPWDSVSHWTWGSLTQLGWPVSPRNLLLPLPQCWGCRSVVSHGVFGLRAGELSSWPYLCSKGFPVCRDPRPSGNDPGTRHWAHLFGRTQRPSLLQVPSGLGFTVSSFCVQIIFQNFHLLLIFSPTDRHLAFLLLGYYECCWQYVSISFCVGFYQGVE